MYWKIHILYLAINGAVARFFISVRFSEWVSESRSVVSNSLHPHGLYSSWNSPGQYTGVGNLSLLQGIFPTQGSSPDLPHCRWILYQLSHREVHESRSVLSNSLWPHGLNSPGQNTGVGSLSLLTHHKGSRSNSYK